MKKIKFQKTNYINKQNTKIKIKLNLPDKGNEVETSFNLFCAITFKETVESDEF